MLKRGISQMFELKACVFWAPGSQELAMLGRQICRSVHWTYFDPTSSGCEHTAEVWCGTVTIVFHVAGGIVTKEQCWLSCAEDLNMYHHPGLCGVVSAHWHSEWYHILTSFTDTICHKLYPVTAKKPNATSGSSEKKKQTQTPAAWPFYNILT